MRKEESLTLSGWLLGIASICAGIVGAAMVTRWLFVAGPLREGGQGFVTRLIHALVGGLSFGASFYVVGLACGAALTAVMVFLGRWSWSDASSFIQILRYPRFKASKARFRDD